MRQEDTDAIQLIVRNILYGAFNWFKRDFKKEPGAKDVVEQGAGFGDLEHDTEIGADKALGRFFFSAFSEEQRTFGRIAVEGSDDVSFSGEGVGDLCVFIDPLDGSLNFARSDVGLCLPYTSIVTVYGRKDNLTYDDVIVCGLTDLRSGDILLARKIENGYRTEMQVNRSPSGSPTKTRDVDKIDLGQDIVICEPYYADREWIASAFKDEKGWLRSPGSAAYEMGLVARGVALLYACKHQKQHEGPGGRALVLGAGGYVCDFEGKNIGSRHIDFKSQDDIILAANASVGHDLFCRLRR